MGRKLGATPCFGKAEQGSFPLPNNAVAWIERSVIRGLSNFSTPLPDCAEPLIGRAFARPVGCIRATQLKKQKGPGSIARASW